MKYLMIIVACVFCTVSIYSLTYAEPQIDHWCKTDCIGRGNTPGNCNSICAVTDNSGEPIKNTECVSSCLKKGWTKYNCYRECEGEEGNTQKTGSSH